MELTLTPELEAKIQEQMATGRFHTPTEMLDTALEAFRDMNPPETLETFNAALQEGIDELDRGDSFSEQEARAYIANLRAKL